MKLALKQKQELYKFQCKLAMTNNFKMSYQHDLIVKEGDKLRLLGSIKTSSKDRIGQDISMDKFLYHQANKNIHSTYCYFS